MGQESQTELPVASYQKSQTEPSHCIWYGVCNEKQYCPYNGPPKALNSSAIAALKTYCSHLIPDNHKDGEDINLCCDSDQVCIY